MWDVEGTLIPLSVVMVLIGVLRYFVSKLMRTSQLPDSKIIKEGQLIIRARNLRASANFIPVLEDFERRALYDQVRPFLIRQVFTQIFAFINVQLFNSLLLRRECCSYCNGEYVRSGLAMLERWCYKTTEEYSGSAWDELNHIRQAIAFLVIHQKPKIKLSEISRDLCPMLSIQHLYIISTMYWDDKHGTYNLSPEVVSNMRILMAEDSTNVISNNSFLLDDDSSIPFSTDDLTKSMDPISISDIEPPPLLRESSGFSFLASRSNYKS